MKTSIKDYIKENEGLRLKPYRCLADKLTIGYGRNLDDVGISKTEAEYMLAGDIGRCFESLTAIFGQPLFMGLSYNRKMVLVDMVFNLGTTRFLRFEKLIRAVRYSNFVEAANQILDSKYAKQLPNRSEKNYRFMLRG